MKDEAKKSRMQEEEREGERRGSLGREPPPDTRGQQNGDTEHAQEGAQLPEALQEKGKRCPERHARHGVSGTCSFPIRGEKKKEKNKNKKRNRKKTRAREEAAKSPDRGRRDLPATQPGLSYNGPNEGKKGQTSGPAPLGPKELLRRRWVRRGPGRGRAAGPNQERVRRRRWAAVPYYVWIQSTTYTRPLVCVLARLPAPARPPTPTLGASVLGAACPADPPHKTPPSRSWRRSAAWNAAWGASTARRRRTPCSIHATASRRTRCTVRGTRRARAAPPWVPGEEPRGRDETTRHATRRDERASCRGAVAVLSSSSSSSSTTTWDPTLCRTDTAYDPACMCWSTMACRRPAATTRRTARRPTPVRDRPTLGNENKHNRCARARARACWSCGSPAAGDMRHVSPGTNRRHDGAPPRCTAPSRRQTQAAADPGARWKKTRETRANSAIVG